MPHASNFLEVRAEGARKFHRGTTSIPRHFSIPCCRMLHLLVPLGATVGKPKKLKGAAPLRNLSVWEPRFGGFAWIGLGGLAVFNWDQSEAVVASATTRFHFQDPSLSTECSRCEKPSACFSVLGVAGRTRYTVGVLICPACAGLVYRLRAPEKKYQQ